MIRSTLWMVIVVIGVVYGGSVVEDEPVAFSRRDENDDLATQGTGIDYMKQFGALTMLANHPMFANLGLTQQQNLGVMTALLTSGLLNPNALRGNPFHPNTFSRPTNLQHFPISPTPFPNSNFSPTGNLFNPTNNQLDPYFLLLLSHYSKYLPYGLGSQGIYGSSGLPKVKPLGIVKYNDKN